MLYLKLRKLKWFQQLDNWAYFYRDILVPLGFSLAFVLYMVLAILSIGTGIFWLTMLAFLWPFPVILFFVIRVNM